MTSMLVCAWREMPTARNGPPPERARGDEELIGEVFADGGARGEVVAGLVDDGVGHLLGANAFFAEAGEGFGDVIGGDFAGEDEAGTARGRVEAKPPVSPFERGKVNARNCRCIQPQDGNHARCRVCLR